MFKNCIRLCGILIMLIVVRSAADNYDDEPNEHDGDVDQNVEPAVDSNKGTFSGGNSEFLQVTILEALPICSVGGNRRLTFVHYDSDGNPTIAHDCSNIYRRLLTGEELDEEYGDEYGVWLDVGTCSYTHKDRTRVVVKKHTVDQHRLTLCDNQGQFNITICQLHVGCVPLVELQEYTHDDEGTCESMARKLPSQLFDKAFVKPERKCDLSDILLRIFAQNSNQDLNILNELDVPALAPPSPSMHEKIDACRHGIYENVYYNSSGAPTHCVIHFAHEHRGKCLPVHDLIAVILKEAQLPYKVNSLEDNTIEYRRFILVVRSWVYGANTGEHDAWRQGFWNQKKGLNSQAYRKLFYEPALLFDRTHLDPFVIKFSSEFENLILGPRVFCDMALTHFPMRHKDIFDGVPPMPCTPVIGSVDSNQCQASRRARFVFPIGINMVYFSSDTTEPAACYVPKEHYQIEKRKKEGCLSYETAQNMLSAKDDSLEEERDYKRRYLVEAALGLTDSPRKQDFYVRDRYDDDEKSIVLSPHAFCSAIVEMIPFKNEVMNYNVGDCY